MSRSTTKANEIIALIEKGLPVSAVKTMTSVNDDEWYRYSSKAYNLLLTQAQKIRKEQLKQKNILAASNEEIAALLSLNGTLANYALSLSSFSTPKEFEEILELSKRLPETEKEIVEYIGKITFETRMRAMQKKGRIEKFEYF